MLTFLFCYLFIYFLDVPDDILEQLKRLKDGLDAINKWKEEVKCPLKVAPKMIILIIKLFDSIL